MVLLLLVHFFQQLLEKFPIYLFSNLLDLTLTLTMSGIQIGLGGGLSKKRCRWGPRMKRIGFLVTMVRLGSFSNLQDFSVEALITAG